MEGREVDFRSCQRARPSPPANLQLPRFPIFRASRETLLANYSAAFGEGFAGEVAEAGFADHHVVLDADAAEGRQRVDQFPVDRVRQGAFAEGAEQRVDEVDARLDGEALPLRDDRRVAQERILR